MKSLKKILYTITVKESKFEKTTVIGELFDCFLYNNGGFKIYKNGFIVGYCAEVFKKFPNN